MSCLCSDSVFNICLGSKPGNDAWRGRELIVWQRQRKYFRCTRQTRFWYGCLSASLLAPAWDRQFKLPFLSSGVADFAGPGASWS